MPALTGRLSASSAIANDSGPSDQGLAVDVHVLRRQQHPADRQAQVERHRVVAEVDRQPQARRGAARSCARPRRRPRRPRPATGPTAPGGPCAARSARGRWRAPSRAAPRRARSSRAWSRGRSGRPSGPGTSSAASQPCDANSDRRPSRTASLSRSSGKWEKNCQGVRAPHSSPMNSIGRERRAEQQRRTARDEPRGERRRGPVADRPVADLVVVLQVGDEPVPGIRRVSTGAPWLRPRKLLQVPSCRNTRVMHVGEPGQPGGREVGVVALVLAGERRRAGCGGRRRPTARAARSRRRRGR